MFDANQVSTIAALPEVESALPRPAAKMAMLVSAGITRPTYTLHFFVESKRCKDGIEFVYQCSQTHARRRFGLLP